MGSPIVLLIIYPSAQLLVPSRNKNFDEFSALQKFSMHFRDFLCILEII